VLESVTVSHTFSVLAALYPEGEQGEAAGVVVWMCCDNM